MSSPTQRTLAMLREDGYRAEVVERFCPHTKRRKDLFSFIDLVAARSGEPIIGVQATSTGNLSSRWNKIVETPEIRAAARTWIEAGGRILLIGWKKYAKPLPGERRLWRPTRRWMGASDLD